MLGDRPIVFRVAKGTEFNIVRGGQSLATLPEVRISRVVVVVPIVEVVPDTPADVFNTVAIVEKRLFGAVKGVTNVVGAQGTLHEDCRANRARKVRAGHGLRASHYEPNATHTAGRLTEGFYDTALNEASDA